MTREQADFIAQLRAGPITHSWRRIAEVVHEKYPDLVSEELSGNQLEGSDLCDQAFLLIYGMSMNDASKHPQMQQVVDQWL